MSIIQPQTLQVNTTDTEQSTWEEDDGNNSSTNNHTQLLISTISSEATIDYDREDNSANSNDINTNNILESENDDLDQQDLQKCLKSNQRRLSDHTPEGIAYWIVKYPILLAICIVIFVELILYFSVRLFVASTETLIIWRGRRLQLKQKLREATSYEEWARCASELDTLDGLDTWKREDESSTFDWRLIRRVLRLLRQFRNGADKLYGMKKLKRLLMDGALKSNLGGVENVGLYSRCYFGTKNVVDEYVGEVTECIDTVYSSNLISIEEKRQFFQRASKSYGRTGLCLSGGATFGYYHLGVIKALLDADALPEVISGTSAGSLIASYICTRTTEKLKEELNPSLSHVFTACDISWGQFFYNLYKTGAAFDPEHWVPKMELVTRGTTTFLEAYKLTGRILNITVIADEEHSPPKLLNYKTAPDVVIYSAVLASSAVPGILPPMELKRKLPDGSIVSYLEEGRLWRDGSLRIDIPLMKLHQMFRVNYTIVSQVNPHVILFFYEPKGSSGRPTAHRRGKGWRGGFLASYLEHYLKLDLLKYIRLLRDLHLLPRPVFRNQDFTAVFLQKFDGSITILPKISFGDYLHIITDPTSERMARYILLGQRNTWPKIKMIKNRMIIESKLAKYLHAIENV